MTLKLGTKKYLTGRSLASELASQVSSNRPVIIDFNGVENITQSFMSELLITFLNKGIKLESIELTHESDRIRAIYNSEVERLTSLKL